MIEESIMFAITMERIAIAQLVIFSSLVIAKTNAKAKLNSIIFLYLEKTEMNARY